MCANMCLSAVVNSALCSFLVQLTEAGHCINDLFYSAGDMAVSEKNSYRKNP